jgi:bis(5'-nucleosyl)-tetraphosphatase (symmetrical)
MPDNADMALYLIGDVQGCHDALARLLQALDFSPSRDTLFLLGDLINRGPDNVGVLRRLRDLGGSARCLLGNHDLHMLALHRGLVGLKRGDTVQDILDAPDREDLMQWLQQQSMALRQDDCLMVHAGVLPQWSSAQTLSLAAEMESVLRGPEAEVFFRHMYGNLPDQWHDDLRGPERWRVIVNGLTRLRFCTPDGRMDFMAKEGLSDAPAGYLPWFDVPERRTREVRVVFGHWSTLGGLTRPDVKCLDTGCVWGGPLSAWALEPHGPGRTIQVPAQA